jgi:hypothetical protein
MKNLNFLQKHIENTTLSTKELKQKIMKILVLTNDMLKVKMLTDKIIAGDFSGLKDNEIKDLSEELKYYINDTTNKSKYIETNKKPVKIEVKPIKAKVNKPITKEQVKKSNDADEVKQLKEQIRLLQSQVNTLTTVVSKINITENGELIVIPDEDINQLYINRLSGSKDLEYKKAFIINHKSKIHIVKSYYDIGMGVSNNEK